MGFHPQAPLGIVIPLGAFLLAFVVWAGIGYFREALAPHASDND